MRASKTLALLIIVFIISAVSIALAFNAHKIADAPFTIAITKQHAKLFENYKALNKDLFEDVTLEIYANEAELMKAVYGGSVDAFSINVFSYLEQYAELPMGKAILGLPADYYLIAKQPGEVDRPKIGIFDETLSFYMLQGVKYTTVAYSDQSKRLQALNDGLIDYAIISSIDYNPENSIIFKKMSALGYKEDLFILTRPWIDSDIEGGLDLIKQLSKILPEDIKAPNEVMLMKAMSELFKDEKIPTRYYYKDLVYYDQP